MTCLMVASAAMTNVRRIHHYWEEKRNEESQKIAAEKGSNNAHEQQDVSFSSFLKSLLIGRRSYIALPKTYLGY